MKHGRLIVSCCIAAIAVVWSLKYEGRDASKFNPPKFSIKEMMNTPGWGTTMAAKRWLKDYREAMRRNRRAAHDPTCPSDPKPG